jgi:hypothetical protein
LAACVYYVHPPDEQIGSDLTWFNECGNYSDSNYVSINSPSLDSTLLRLPIDVTISLSNPRSAPGYLGLVPFLIVFQSHLWPTIYSATLELSIESLTTLSCPKFGTA